LCTPIIGNTFLFRGVAILLRRSASKNDIGGGFISAVSLIRPTYSCWLPSVSGVLLCIKIQFL